MPPEKGAEGTAAQGPQVPGEMGIGLFAVTTDDYGFSFGPGGFTSYLIAPLAPRVELRAPVGLHLQGGQRQDIVPTAYGGVGLRWWLLPRLAVELNGQLAFWMILNQNVLGNLQPGYGINVLWRRKDPGTGILRWIHGVAAGYTQQIYLHGVQNSLGVFWAGVVFP